MAGRHGVRAGEDAARDRELQAEVRRVPEPQLEVRAAAEDQCQLAQPGAYEADAPGHACPANERGCVGAGANQRRGHRPDGDAYVLLHVQARQRGEVWMGERTQHPAGRRDEVGAVALPEDEHGSLSLDDDGECVGERAVVPEGPHAAQRREPLLDRRAVDADEADADLVAKRRPDGGAKRGRAAADLDRAHGEEGCVTGREIASDCEDEQREPEPDRADRRRQPCDVGESPAGGQGNGTSGRPPAGGHAADFAAARGSPTTYPRLVSRFKVDFDDRLWERYELGRALPEHSLAVWMDAVARHAVPERPLSVLDLGSGTGRFSPSLATRFGGPVYGVEPAAKMRDVARRVNAHPAVTYLDGRAESIPLPDSSCDLAFLYFVLHHFDRSDLAAGELARVLRPSGLVCIRTQFSDRLGDVKWRSYFPRALEVERTMFPSLDETMTTFRASGFEPVALEEVEFEVAPTPAAHLERLRHRAISTLELLTEDELEAGFAAMAEAVAAAAPAPVVERGDLLVLRR